MNRSALSLGFNTAVATVFIGIIYSVLLGVLMRKFTPPEWSSFPIYSKELHPVSIIGAGICQILSLLNAPLSLIMFSCIHHVTPKEKRFYSFTGLVFIIMTVVLSAQFNFTNIHIIRMILFGINTEGLEQFTVWNYNSAYTASSMLAWTLFAGTAFLSSVFTGKKKIRYVLIAFGVVSYFGIPGFFLGNFIILTIYAIGITVLGILLSILIAFHFRTLMQDLDNKVQNS